MQRAGARHRGREGDAAAVAAAGQRALGLRGGSDRGRDTRHDFAVDARLRECFQLLFQPAEDAGVAALESHDRADFLCMLDQQRVDRLLAGAVAEAALADVDPARGRRNVSQGGVGERVVQHHVGLREAPRAAHRDQVRRARACSDEDDAAAHVRLHLSPATRRWCGCSRGRR